MQLRPLPVTDADSSAVRLFVERAMAVNSGFTLDGGETETVIELCQRLDGLPLAIELAAARCGLLTPAELLAGIDDRFRLLHGGRRRHRQRTLESTLDWSYHLLDDDEQRALRSLGVFVGTFDLDAAAAVLDVDRHDAVDLIDSLVAKSLVDRTSADGVSRFRLLETTAAYAQQALAAHDETAAIRDRHLAHYHRLSEQIADVSLFWGYGASVDRFGRNRANVLAALDWASLQERPQVASTVLRGALGALLDDTRHDAADRRNGGGARRSGGRRRADAAGVATRRHDSVIRLPAGGRDEQVARGIGGRISAIRRQCIDVVPLRLGRREGISAVPRHRGGGSSRDRSGAGR